MYVPKIITESATKGDAILLGILSAFCSQLSSAALLGLKGQIVEVQTRFNLCEFFTDKAGSKLLTVKS